MRAGRTAGHDDSGGAEVFAVTPIEIGIVCVAALFVLLFLGMPIGACMGVAGAAGLAFLTNFDGAIMKLGQTAFNSTASYILAVIPLFILMGELAFISKLTEDAYSTLYVWLGRLPGGLAIATIGACAAFAAVCGSSSATASTIASIAFPEMRKYQYDEGFALGTIAAGGTLGILIPPSTAFVLYALITEQSIGKLFLSGVVPGILLSLLFACAILLVTWRKRSELGGAANLGWRARWISLKGIWGVFALFIIVMGGIYTGVFTATEAAAVGAFAAFIIAVIRGHLNRKSLGGAFFRTLRTTGMIFVLVIGATLFGYFLEASNISRAIGQFVSGLHLSPVLVLMVVIVVYLILGCLMDAFSMLLIMTPIVLPVITGIGYDPIWFGVITVITVEAGLITPPIGMNVFIMAGVAPEVPMFSIFRGVTIYVIAMMVCIALLIAFPQIALFLPNAMK
jgi:C4-dicarboxylate transporter, DctM subunit